MLPALRDVVKVFRDPRAAALLPLALWGCSAGAPPAGPTGQLVFTDSAPGQVVITDLGTGASRTLQSPLGDARGLTFSPSVREVAFAAVPANPMDARLVVLDVDSAATREIAAEAGAVSDSFSWGAGGFFAFRTYAPGANSFGVNRDFVVEAGSTKGRPITDGNAYDLRVSPFGARLAYARCVDAAMWPYTDPPCAMELVVESAAGRDTKVLASGSRYWPLEFTPDDRSIIAVEQTASARRVVLYDLATASTRELGLAPLDPSAVLDYLGAIKGGTLVSPNGREVILQRGTTTVAVKLDGSGERIISEDLGTKAVFSASGAVVYGRARRDIIEGDIAVPSSSFWVLNGDVRREILPRKRAYIQYALSRSGRLAAVFTADGLHFVSIDEASEVRHVPSSQFSTAGFGPIVLDFDGNEQGVVVAVDLADGRYEIVYVGIDGMLRTLARASSYAYGP